MCLYIVRFSTSIYKFVKILYKRKTGIVSEMYKSTVMLGECNEVVDANYSSA